MNDPQGRDPNEMHRHYLTLPLYGGQTMGFPNPHDIDLLVTTARHAALLMGYLHGYFKERLVPGHIMDNDDNPGEYLRRDLRALGFWKDEATVRPVAPVKIRICKSNESRPRCSCKMDDDNDCITCGERVWIYDEVPEHNCPPGFKR